MRVFRIDRCGIGRSFVANRGVDGAGSHRSMRSRTFRRSGLPAYPTLLEHTRGGETRLERAEAGSLGFVLLGEGNLEKLGMLIVRGHKGGVVPDAKRLQPVAQSAVYTFFPSSIQTGASQTDRQGTEGEGVIMKRSVG